MKQQKNRILGKRNIQKAKPLIITVVNTVGGPLIMLHPLPVQQIGIGMEVTPPLLPAPLTLSYRPPNRFHEDKIGTALK